MPATGRDIKDSSYIASMKFSDIFRKTPVPTSQPPKYQVLGWVGNHHVCKFEQASFPKGYLNIWLEYSNIDEGFIHRHIDGFVSGFELVAIRNREGGKEGTNLIYRLDTAHAASIPGVELLPGESAIGIMDCDFSCLMVMSFRPSLDTLEGMAEFYRWEI